MSTQRRYGTGRGYDCFAPADARCACEDVRRGTAWLGRHVSVTEVLDTVLAKNGLIKWAADCAADDAAAWASTALATIGAAQDDPMMRATLQLVAQARDRWATAHNRQRERAAARGRDLHRIVELLAQGVVAANVPPDVLPYLGALRNFCEREKPQVVISESQVLSTRGYAGTLDAVHSLGPRRTRDLLVIRDWKSRKDEAHARLYGEEVLQLAAYRYATHLRDKATGEVRRMPRVDAAEVVLLWPPASASDPGHRIERVRADREAHRIFLRLLDVYRWQAAQAEAT